LKGLDKFRKHFDGLDRHYVLIGGSACFIVMDEAGIDFRATRDLDIVLCVEALNGDFAARFWQFVEAGGYQQREKSTGDKEFYRFSKPRDADFPFMLELFSRKPDQIVFEGGGAITPLPIDQEIDSLSAIILDDDYYEALMGTARVVDTVRVLDERLLIPFKAKAFLDLSERRENGDEIDSKEIKKHRNDVFRLLQLLGAGESVKLPEVLSKDLALFADAVARENALTPKDIGLIGTLDDQVARLRRAYGL